MREQEEILRVSGLRVSFHTDAGIIRAVRGVDLELYKGETLAIVGESGSGKSVTARSIMGILPETAVVEGGSVIFDGTDLIELNEDEMRQFRGKRIGMIFQDPFQCLNPTMKIGNQLAESIHVTENLSGVAAKERALNLLADVGIADPERRYAQYPFELSGGMCQRIITAIALSGNPDVLICDEPTTALDVTIQAQILDLIKKIKSERGLSVIFITHDLGVVAGIADRVAVMYDGKVTECASVDDIFYRPEHEYTKRLIRLSAGMYD